MLQKKTFYEFYFQKNNWQKSRKKNPVPNFLIFRDGKVSFDIKTIIICILLKIFIKKKSAFSTFEYF
jgi:hypothetical protein